MSKFNMDFEYNDSKTEEITEATSIDAMDCAMAAAECSAILVNYQKIQLDRGGPDLPRDHQPDDLADVGVLQSE